MRTELKTRVAVVEKAVHLYGMSVVRIISFAFADYSRNYDVAREKNFGHLDSNNMLIAREEIILEFTHITENNNH